MRASLVSLGLAAVGMGGWALRTESSPEYRLVERAANSTVHAIDVHGRDRWSVQILADIQDGFLYLPRVLAEGEALGVDAVVVAGDLARGDGGDHLSLLLRQLALHPPQVPLFAVPGNHDTVRPVDRQRFVRCFGATEFEFRIGHTWFVGLDSTRGFTKSDRDRLQARIAHAERGGERVVVVRHHSPLPSPDPRENPYASEELTALLEHPSVAFVLSGHAHHWSAAERRGVRFVVAPPSGDRSHGQGQTAISYLVLRWTGTQFELEHRQFFRSNWLELEAALQHVILAHWIPSLSGFFSRGAVGSET